MDDLDRPILGLKIDCEIEDNQNKIDILFWQQLAAMQVPTPAAASMQRKTFPTLSHPPIPKSPAAVLQILVDYASLENMSGGLWVGNR